MSRYAGLIKIGPLEPLKPRTILDILARMRWRQHLCAISLGLKYDAIAGTYYQPEPCDQEDPQP